MPQSRIRHYLRHGTLPQLAVFEASARLGSFTRAAQELHLAQPTVSAQIGKLTETLGTPLFEQVGKRIFLTEPGRRAYAHCEEIFRVFGRLDDALSELSVLETGRLHVAAGSACESFVPRMLAGFSRVHPSIEVVLRIRNRSQLVERLVGNEDDLYVFTHPPEEREIVRQAIVANPLVVLARADDPLAKVRDIPLARLAQRPLLLREPGSGTRDAALRLFERAGLAPKVHMEVESDGAIRQAVLAGLGVAVLHRDVLSLASERNSLVALDVIGFPLERHWHFVYPVGRQLSCAAKAFIDHVRVEVRGLVPRSKDVHHRPATLTSAIRCSTASSSPTAQSTSTATAG
ncbi:MAG: LysR family transcriptional regulator [Burkholderiales bacterium]|nr:LysR family transcriptional regulator [Burkholderiales bacterium]